MATVRMYTDVSGAVAIRFIVPLETARVIESLVGCTITGVDVDLDYAEARREEDLARWRIAVAEGKTELGFEQFCEERDS